MGHSKWSILMHAFEDYGLKFKSMSSPEATELAKILSTTRYGVNLLFADMQSSAIHDLSLDYKEVVTEWETTYNEGLDEVGMPQFKRPILTPPTYAIGGHCVYENVRILKDALPRFSPIQSMLMLIKEFGRLNYKEEKNDN